MSTQSNVVNESLALQESAVQVISPWRRFYWSVRREVWENFGVFLAPAVVAVFVILGVLIGVSRGTIQFNMTTTNGDGAGQTTNMVMTPGGTVTTVHGSGDGVFMVSMLAIMGVSFLAALFYCVGALHGERQDRSILFWKSLPVSDLTTVLAKLALPAALLPAFTWVLMIVTQILIALIHAVAHASAGQQGMSIWSAANIVHIWLVVFYQLITIHVLWYAPIYGYALVVSAWAKRAPFLWAVLPPVLLGVVEKIAFGTSNVFSLLQDRLSGHSAGDMVNNLGGMAFGVMPELTPLHFLANPALWLGLLFAAICVAGAVRLRRSGGVI